MLPSALKSVASIDELVWKFSKPNDCVLETITRRVCTCNKCQIAGQALEI